MPQFEWLYKSLLSFYKQLLAIPVALKRGLPLAFVTCPQCGELQVDMGMSTSLGNLHPVCRSALDGERCGPPLAAATAGGQPAG